MDPVAKGRPRTTIQNGSIRTYTPEKTQVAEAELAACFWPHRDKGFPQHVPVRLAVTFYIKKSKWNKNKLELPAWRPDLDNYIKCLLDSANGILFYDDSQITTMRLAKRWSDNGHGYITLKLEEDKT